MSNVIYIKLPLYVKEFMRAEYGDPAILPSCSVLDNLMKKCLFKEVSFDRHNSLSMSQRLWKIKGNVSELANVCDFNRFTCFTLPDVVKSNGILCFVDDSYNLNLKSARIFRNEACNVFWTALERYRDNLSVCYAKEGFNLTRSALIEEFMAIHNISVIHYNTINRQWRRISKNNLNRGFDYVTEVRNRCFNNIKARGDIPFVERLNCVKFFERNSIT